MCGIAGCWLASPNRDALARARQALAHRGPDGDGEYFDAASGVGLVHTRLAIIDLSPAGQQPMLSRDGRVALSFNGEIYNYRELLSELAAEGVSFRGHSDTEVLLALYLRYGLAMLPRLNGMFAFAIHDQRSGELLLARDGMGVKPLYACAGEPGFAFASEIKALLPLLVDVDKSEPARDRLGAEPGRLRAGSCDEHDGRESGSLDVAALQRYLTYLWCPGHGTPFAGVRKLAPGTAMVVKNGRVVREWAWYESPTRRGGADVSHDASRTVSSPSPNRTTVGGEGFASRAPALLPPPAGRGTEGDGFAAAVRETLRTAVHRQLVADVPVGAFLSGGLDSSAVVALAREQAPDIHCFTIEQAGGGDAGDAEDLPYAQQVARHLGVKLDVVRVDAADMAADLQEMVWHLDEPLADPAPLNVLYISNLARRHDIKVLLSGAGGDDLFTGYRRHVALRYESLWSWLPRPARRSLGALASRLDQRSAIGRRLARLFASAGADGDARLAGYFAWIRRPDLLSLLTPAMRAAVADIDPAQPMLDYLAGMPEGTGRMHKLLALEQRFFLADHNLIYTDKMAMAAGVEVRVPFLDPDVVELAARIPDRFLQRGRVGKWVLKRAMEPLLPHAVIHRPKTGFGAPLRRWLRGELRPLLADVLGEDSLRRRGLFDPAAVQRLIAANAAGRVDAAYTLLSLLCIEIWCRRFVDGRRG